MKRRRAIWCTVKWLTAPACLLIPAAFLMSRWYAFGLVIWGWGVCVERGVIAFGYDGTALARLSSHLVLEAIDPPAFTRRIAWVSPGAPYMFVSLWVPFLLVAIFAAIARRRSRSVPPGHCDCCGYDLTGNVTGRCPECGKAV